MTRRALAIASMIVVAAMLAMAVVIGTDLPSDAVLPTHWDIAGDADDSSGKWQALLMPAGVAAGASLLFYFLPALEPRRQGLERSQGLYLTSWAGLLLVAVTIQLVTVSAALGWDIAAGRIIMGAVGVMLALIGNQLGKSRSMYMVGIRTPWTLASEEVWIKTHRLGGKLLVAAGLLICMMSLVPASLEVRGLVIGVSIGIAVIVPVAYSYLEWRREKRSQAS